MRDTSRCRHSARCSTSSVRATCASTRSTSRQLGFCTRAHSYKDLPRIHSITT